MTLSLCFWICMLLMLLGGGYYYRARPAEAWAPGIVWVLFLLLGWSVFGAPLHG